MLSVRDHGNRTIIRRVCLLGLAVACTAISAQSLQREIEQAAHRNQARRNDCTVYTRPHQSPYVLPYEPGTERLVWRGREHFARGNGGVGLYAYDFEMPTGTRLVAVRAGEVVAVREGSGMATVGTWRRTSS